MVTDNNAFDEQIPSKENKFFNKKIWRIKDVADFLGVSKGHIYNLTSRREIPYRKKGGLLFFLPFEIFNWIQEGELR